MVKLGWLKEVSSLFARNWLISLLALDLVLLSLHVYLGATLPKIPPLFNIAMDRSLGEFLGYAELGLASILLLFVFAKAREPLMLAFAIIFAVMMLDDSIGLHEVGGGFFANGLGLTGDMVLDGKDEGEIVVWLIYVALLVPVLLVGLYRTPMNRWFRVVGLVLLSGILVCFAVVLDAAHSGICRIGGGFPLCFQLMDLIEDGGEKITQSLILTHVIYLSRNTAAPALFDFTQHLLPARMALLFR